MTSEYYSLSVLSAKLHFPEIGQVHRKLWSSEFSMLKSLNSNLLEFEATLIGLAPGSILKMFEKRVDIHKYFTRSPKSFTSHRNLSKGQEAISYAGTRLWNEILIDIRRGTIFRNLQRTVKGTVRSTCISRAKHQINCHFLRINLLLTFPDKLATLVSWLLLYFFSISFLFFWCVVVASSLICWILKIGLRFKFQF